MHYVDCGSQPEVLAKMKREMPKNANGTLNCDRYFKNMDKERSGDYRRLIDYLAKKYNWCCAYCEAYLGRDERLHCRGEISNRNKGTIKEEDKDSEPGKYPDSLEHFRPRDLFPERCATWENLNYACSHCDGSKDNKFPGFVQLNEMTKKCLEQKYAKKKEHTYVDPSREDGYVDPRDSLNKAEVFFTYNKKGDILPNPDLDNVNWSKAVRTIFDFGLDRDEAVGYRGNFRKRRRDSYKDLELARKIGKKLEKPSYFAFSSFHIWMDKNAGS